MTPRRLHRSRDIRAVFAARNAAHGRFMTVHAARRVGDMEPSSKAEDHQARVTVIVGRDVGGSVDRNRAKRRLRAVLAAGPLPPDLDLVVRARPATVDADFQALQAESGDLISRVAARAVRLPAKPGGRQA